MEIKVMHAFPDELQAEWDTLLKSSPTNVPFLRFGYQKLWWQTCGGGEWEWGEPYLLLGYEKEKLVGIAPLFRVPFHGEHILTFIGAKNISDYLDFIVAKQNAKSFSEAVLAHLTCDASHLWDKIIFSNVPASSPLLPIFQNKSSSDNFACSIQELQSAPYLPLPKTWDAYLINLDKKQRHEIRRKIRRLEKEADNFRFFFITDMQQLLRYQEVFFSLMRQDHAKAQFLTQRMMEHMQKLLSWSFREEILKLFFLEINGVTAAGYFCFDDQNTIYIYNSGFHNEFQYFSPGWLLLSYLIQWSIENSHEKVDFMRGNEKYKYQFGALNSAIYEITLSKNRD